MQLFVLDYDPERSAAALCDKHLRKMCLETAQILSAVICRQGKISDPALPKPYNLRHPVICAIDNPVTINYAVLYNLALHREYFFRFSKNHIYAALSGIYYHTLFENNASSEHSQLTFCRSFSGIEIAENDLVEAYRIYYRFKKTLIRDWHYTRSWEPEWLKLQAN